MRTAPTASHLIKVVSLLAIAFAMVFALVPAASVSAFAQGSAPASSTQSTVVRVGYFEGDPLFQAGYSDDERKSGYAYDYYQEIAPYAGWDYEYVYGTREEMLEALKNGEIDIIAGITDDENPTGTLLVAADDMDIADTPRHFAVAPGKQAIFDELTWALEQIGTVSPKFEAELWQKYYAPDTLEQSLNDEELAWLADKGTINIGYLLANLPISGQDDEGNPSGVVSVVMQSMEEYLNVAVNPVAFKTFGEALEALNNGQIDAIMPVYADPWLSEHRGIYQSASFVSDRIMIVFTSESTDYLAKIAVNEGGLGQANYVRANLPDAELVMCPDRAAAFEAVKDGDANCALGPASIYARYIAANYPSGEFQTAYLDGTEYYAIGSRLSEPMFAQILNKFANHLNPTLMNNAMVKFSRVAPKYSFTEVLKRYSLLIIAFLLVVFFVLGFVFFKYRKNVNAFNARQTETRKALEDALAVASNANEAKTTFLSSMSHDIRTPMNGIIGMTALAAANIDNRARVEDCLAKIAASGKHLLALINEILDVSKIESGKFELSEEDFSLSDMVEDLIVMNMTAAREKGLDMSMHVVNVEHEMVEADRTRLQQVYTNLVSNAIKYTPEGGRVEITLSEKPSGSPTVGRYDFTVKDTGIGMSEEFMPKIFDAFARADDKDAMKQQGSGLGLPIALSVARMMNGDITVESELGKGSTFTATVFMKFADYVDASYEDFIDLNVLVVDDDKDTCLYTCTLLDSLGMKSEFCLSGREAVDMVEARFNEENSYFAVIIDWIMPGMDGLETIKAIRARVPEEIPLIIVSAYDWSAIEVEARAAGVQYFIGKPLFKSRLAQLFGQIVGAEAEDELTDLNTITDSKPLSGKRALLAEDNDLNAEIAVNFFGMAGMEVERAIDGKNALEMMKSSEPGYYDCIFMDIKMPIMNGLESASAIRGLDREDAREIPIFAMTANAFVDDVNESMKAGMNEHFAKPLDFEKIIVVVSQYLA